MPAHSFNDYEKLNDENKGLRRELETANQAIKALREREVALRDALENEVMYHGKNCICRACQILSSPSQPSNLDSEGVEE